MAAQVGDGPLGRYGKGLTAIEISAAVTPVVSWGVGAGARDRALVGLIIK